MARKVTQLTRDHLAELAEHPRTCLRWQLDAVSRSRVAAGEELPQLRGWFDGVLAEWGSCGQVVMVDDTPVAVALYAPAPFLPGLAELPTAPPSPDAVTLACLYVEPEHRGGGLARMLVQGAARDLVTRELTVLETFGSHADSAAAPRLGALSGPAHECVLPADFWAAVGFKTQRAHGTTPRMRMDLRTTRSWMTEVEQAVERLVDAVRPAREPQGKAVRSDLRVP